MESFESLDVSSIRCPCCAAVEQQRHADSLLNSHLGGYGKLVVETASVQQPAKGRGGCFDTVLNVTVQTAVVTQYQVCKLMSHVKNISVY